jgi:hypothetical protein
MGWEAVIRSSRLNDASAPRLGIAKAKSEGKQGRATTARAKTELFLEMVRVLAKTLEAVAEELKITARSPWRGHMPMRY